MHRTNIDDTEYYFKDKEQPGAQKRNAEIQMKIAKLIQEVESLKTGVTRRLKALRNLGRYGIYRKMINGELKMVVKKS